MKTADALSTLHSLALLPPLDLGGGHMERIQGCLAWFKVSSNSTSAPLGSVFPNLTTPVGSPPSPIASMVSTIPFTLSGPRDLCLYIILYYKAFFTRMLPYPQTGLSVLGGQRRHLISFFSIASGTLVWPEVLHKYVLMTMDEVLFHFISID